MTNNLRLRELMVLRAAAVGMASRSSVEWQRDRAQRETYDAVTDAVGRHSGVYGIGVESVYKMVHGAPPSHFPEHAELVVAHNQLVAQ